jgi:hypothetical protein
MQWRVGLGALVAVGVLTAGTVSAQEQAIEVRLSSRFAVAQETVRSLVRVAPHPDNRLLRVAIDSPDFFRSSDVPLEGALAARNHFFAWKTLPPGSYELVVIVMGSDGPRTRRQVTFEVVGAAPGPDFRPLGGHAGR